ncbi:carboxylating nicotinate-nucleotide diphosphorylase [Methanolobus sediminis]|uniref:Nicotinate-nucleotide pyrophosphorylase [carboxylating] n=1 Tax=Methanolobus sediminis TaxID=3072978 RepID=A0AA51UML9_9EURY|nr:carboxylating nicotinate-nucleotide diphosphorylase [Methanolobus sediminis]WMW26408.1 carboxylating nicotinate-nucleotide diphosphorylase [Methanolobus sediminis]
MYTHEIESFLEEDLGYNDISCKLVPDHNVEAIIFTKEDCTLAGVDVAISFFDYFGIEYSTDYSNGDRLSKNDVIFTLKGSSLSILRTERLVLNFLGHLCGIATNTSRCVDIVRSYSDKTKIACTRKTTPGLRKYEKMAVIAGGGDPHRFNLTDSVMIKDNHVKMMGVEAAIKSAKEKAGFTQKIDVEVESPADALVAAKAGADIIMLDNMDPENIVKTVDYLKSSSISEHIIIEVSGGINMDNLEEYAKTGVDIISMGSLIHRSQWIDVSLEIVKVQE